MTDEHAIKHAIQKTARGDRAAFEHLYVHLIDRVYAYVASRTSDKTIATDLTQDIFIDIYTALPGFRYESLPQFYAFVFTITKRKLARHYEHRTKESLERTDLPIEDALPASPEADRVAEDEIKRALTHLPEETREILILHHWSRYTFAEIATMLDMTESAVRVRHHRALATLRETLTHHV